MKKITPTLAALAVLFVTGCQSEIKTCPASDSNSYANLLTSIKATQTKPQFSRLSCNSFSAVAESCKGQLITITNAQVNIIRSDSETPGYFEVYIQSAGENTRYMIAFFKSEEISEVSKISPLNEVFSMQGVSLGRSKGGEALFKVTKVVRGVSE